jgi:maltose alpha-D-glucosyltransferase/alpha-amylase
VANLSRSAQPVELDLARYKGRVPVEMLGRTPFPPVGELPYLLTLPAYGFYWFRLTADAAVPSWHSERLAPEDLPVLVLFDGWASLFSDRVVPWRIAMAEKLREDFETAILPRYVAAQRWYAAKGEPLERARLRDTARWEKNGSSWLVTLLDAKEDAYFVPLTLGWEENTDEDRMRLLQPATLARVRQQAAVGVLADAFADEAFTRAVIAAIAANETIATDAGGRLRFVATRAFADLAGPDVQALPVDRPQAQSSNTVVTLGDRLLLKGYRRVRRGVNPEVEVGRHLTEKVRFEHGVPLAGEVTWEAPDGTVMTVALLQAYVRNQGDGWSYTLSYLARTLDEADGPGADSGEDRFGAYIALMETLGTRTAEMHAALARETGDAAFDPEPAEEKDYRDWRERVIREAGETLDELARRSSALGPEARALAEPLLAGREKLAAGLATLPSPRHRTLRTRHHGDYHLGQVLLARNDFIIIDFEGEPGRPLAERKRKGSALRDVAGMLRSFSYARAAAVQRLSATAAERERHEPPAALWEQQARGAFLRAYVAHAGETGLIRSLDDVSGLIALFEFEKALYELRYEMNNRPDWLPVPLAGIAQLLEGGEPTPDG